MVSIRKTDARPVQLLINLTSFYRRVSKNTVDLRWRFEAVAVLSCFVQGFLPVPHVLIPKERVQVRRA